MPVAKAIVLVGPMGVGKTTIGKKLASSLSLPFRDTDAIFVSRFGDISSYFAEHGEQAFRSHEEDIVAEAISEPGVVATGGGAVLSETTRERLKLATVVYLATDGTHMAKRLSQGKRPLLQNGIQDWKRIYEERKSIYEQIANLQVDCSGAPIKQSVQDIRNGLNLND